MGNEFSKLTWLQDARPYMRTLTATQRAVLDELFDRSNAAGKNAHPGRDRLAGAAGVVPDQITRVLKQLRDKGLIRLTAKGNRRTGQADVYELRLPDTDHPTSRVSDETPLGMALDHPTSDEFSSDIEGRFIRHLDPDHPTSMDVVPTDPVTTDPGPTDPEMLETPEEHDIRDVAPTDGEDDPQRSEPDPSPESVSSTSTELCNSHRIKGDARAPFASLPSGSSARAATDSPIERPAMSYDPFSDPFTATCNSDPEPWPGKAPAIAEPEKPAESGPDWGRPFDKPENTDSGDPRDPFSAAFDPEAAAAHRTANGLG